MTSPLLPYANSAILIESRGSVTVDDGRIMSAVGSYYLIKAFLNREQSTGTETGATKIPLRSNTGNLMPGASGEFFLYRGYALQYAVVPSTFILGSSSESGLVYQDISKQYSWMMPGTVGQLRFGEEKNLRAQIERSSGKYGGQGIDSIIYKEIGGIELQVIGGEVQN